MLALAGIANATTAQATAATVARSQALASAFSGKTRDVGLNYAAEFGFPLERITSFTPAPLAVERSLKSN